MGSSDVVKEPEEAEKPESGGEGGTDKGECGAPGGGQIHRGGREGDGGPFVLDENSVNTLVSMGFSEQRVKQTLHVTNNNIEAAMNMLLNEN